MIAPRYRLRTLLILLAVLPPLLWFGWTKYEAWRAEQERRAELRELFERARRRALAARAALSPQFVPLDTAEIDHVIQQLSEIVESLPAAPQTVDPPADLPVDPMPLGSLQP